jgi:hypothetical protein
LDLAEEVLRTIHPIESGVIITAEREDQLSPPVDAALALQGSGARWPLGRAQHVCRGDTRETGARLCSHATDETERFMKEIARID